MIFRWPIDTRPDKILRKRLQVVRTPRVIVIITIIMTAVTGPPLQQRAISKTTAPRVSVGRFIRTAWSWKMIRAFSLNNIKKVSLMNRLCHRFKWSFIHSILPLDVIHIYHRVLIYHFHQLLLFRNSNNNVGNTGGEYINSASAIATTISTWGIYSSLHLSSSLFYIPHHVLVHLFQQSSIIVPTESFTMTLPPLHPFRQQEVSIIDPSFFPSCIDSLDHFSSQDSSMLGRPASSSVQALIYAKRHSPIPQARCWFQTMYIHFHRNNL